MTLRATRNVTVDAPVQTCHELGMLDFARIKNSRLRKLAERGDESGIHPLWLPRIRRVLAALAVATSPGELDLPGWHWHQLKGNRKGTYSVRVSPNWRITFQWDDDGPYSVDLEDYHGG